MDRKLRVWTLAPSLTAAVSHQRERWKYVIDFSGFTLHMVKTMPINTNETVHWIKNNFSSMKEKVHPDLNKSPQSNVVEKALCI